MSRMNEHLVASEDLTEIAEELEQRRAEQQKKLAIIVRQRPDLTAYEEGQVDGRMRRDVLEHHSYPYVRDAHQIAATLVEALTQERRNVEEFLQHVAADPKCDPEDIAYLQGKLSCY